MEALLELGDASSLDALVKESSHFYGEPLQRYSVMQYRLEYRKVMGLTTDCRTYKSQPRRDMHKDNRLSIEQMKRRSELTENQKEFIRHFIGRGKSQFHSIPQLLHALR